MKEETLLEQMTRVRPEVLDENALKLFNKIMEVIDERDELQNRIDKATNYCKRYMYTYGIKNNAQQRDELLNILGGDVDE